MPFFETEINQDRDGRKDQFVPREINTFLHLLLLLRTCPRGQISPKLTFCQTHLSEMNPRRAKQVINTFPSLSCSNYCAIFHLYNVQFSTSLGVSSATCVRTFLRLPTIFFVLLSPPQGEAFDSDENGVACSIFSAFFEPPSQYIGPLLRFI